MNKLEEQTEQRFYLIYDVTHDDINSEAELTNAFVRSFMVMIYGP